MVMKRKITEEGRISIGDEARGSVLAGKVTISGDVRGILIAPYILGDESRPDCKVTTWDSYKRLVLPLQLRQKAGLEAGEEVEVRFRDDGAAMLLKLLDTCTLCGTQSANMISLPNGRLVCPQCREFLSKDES